MTGFEVMWRKKSGVGGDAGGVDRTVTIDKPLQSRRTTSYLSRSSITSTRKSINNIQGREPFSDNTSKYSRVTSNTQKTFKVTKGLTKTKRGGSSSSGRSFTSRPHQSAWNKVLPTIEEAESAYSGMTGIISSFSGHSEGSDSATPFKPKRQRARPGYDSASDFEFENDSLAYSDTEYGVNTTYDTEYTGMTGISALTSVSGMMGLPDIAEDDETNYNTEYTGMTGISTNSEIETNYNTEYTGITRGYSNATDINDGCSRYEEGSAYTEASTAYTTAYTTAYSTAYMHQMMAGAKSDLSQLGSSLSRTDTALTMDIVEDEDIPKGPCDFGFLRGDIKDLVSKGKKGMQGMLRCHAVEPASRKPTLSGRNRSCEYDDTRTNPIVRRSRQSNAMGRSDQQSEQKSLSDCLQ
mmetsp:Transcript_20780/g.42412  ORF Transcript_20780/g.42412 Transcript_20780/m.42412 type:complete len:409 (-) Transcript_20780:230-1456(-)